MIKKTAGEFIDRQRKGAFIFLSRELADVCEKNEKKKKSLVKFSETSIRTMATPVNCACKVLLKDPYM